MILLFRRRRLADWFRGRYWRICLLILVLCLNRFLAAILQSLPYSLMFVQWMRQGSEEGVQSTPLLGWMVFLIALVVAANCSVNIRLRRGWGGITWGAAGTEAAGQQAQRSYENGLKPIPTSHLTAQPGCCKAGKRLEESTRLFERGLQPIRSSGSATESGNQSTTNERLKMTD